MLFSCFFVVKPKIVIHEKAGGEIPSKAVDWALGQCERFYRFKTHEDLDQKVGELILESLSFCLSIHRK